MPDATLNQVHRRWEQYKISIDNYKFYIEMTIKLNAFHYAITGAILSFYFTHADIGVAKWLLLLPVIFSKS